MQAYSGFAEVYDTFMDNVPYDAWTQHLIALMKENGVPEGALVCELGCGTGAVTRRLSAAGFDMIGIDSSEEMLAVAADRQAELSAAGTAGEILYLNQDMREFELYGTVAAVVSICDCMNYITEPGDLLTVFRLVNNYLDPGGVFLFDMNTPYKYETELADHTFAESREDCAFIWDNSYDAETKLNEYDLTVFSRKPEGDYQRFDEVHVQRAWTEEGVRKLLAHAGLKVTAVYGGLTHDAPGEDTDRMVFIAKEVMK